MRLTSKHDIVQTTDMGIDYNDEGGRIERSKLR